MLKFLLIFILVPLLCVSEKLKDPHSFISDDFKSEVKTMQNAVVKQMSRVEDIPEAHMDAVELIIYAGYEPEFHRITTDDGYILGVVRIPKGKANLANDGPKPAVLLQHGLLGSCTNFLTNSPDQSLAFILADAGYDVWLPNSRGNVYSREHKSLSPSNSKFWDFSWDEMAKYDIPAVIDYITSETGNQQVFYVGHSQGTLIAFAKFSEDLQFSKKIAAFFALAPIHTVGSITSPIKMLAPLTMPLDFLFTLVGYDEFLPIDNVRHTFQDYVCEETDNDVRCKNLQMQFHWAKGSTEINQTRTPIYAAHNPAGTSSQNIAHFGQMVNSNKMQKFDYYNPLKNLAKYGQITPPAYSVEKMTVPTVLFTGKLDALSDPTDVTILRSLLNKDIILGDYVYDTYTHCDFIWGANANKDVYSKILQHMKEIIGKK